jgi:hypothetical protein
MSNQILCVGKSDDFDPHRRITHIGGINDQGQQWQITLQDAVQGIESGRWQFHVRVGYRDVPVVVATSRNGDKFITIEVDRMEPSALLSLPRCPRLGKRGPTPSLESESNPAR